MSGAKNDDVVQAFATNRTDGAFCIRVLPRRTTAPTTIERFTGMDGYKLRNSPNIGRSAQPFTAGSIASGDVKSIDEIKHQTISNRHLFSVGMS